MAIVEAIQRGGVTGGNWNGHDPVDPFQAMMDANTSVLEYLPAFETLWTVQNRLVVVYGGAGSGKSHAVAQRIITLFYELKDIRILIIRKTFPSLRKTAMTMLLDILENLGLPYHHHKSGSILSNPFNNNEIAFTSLDNPEKIKSININYIWVEEATDIDEAAFIQLDLRVRRPNPNTGSKNQIFLTFNPIDEFHWLIENYVNSSDAALDMFVHHSTYLDNFTLDEHYVKTLKNLISRDKNLYRIYVLGLPGVLENKIYDNYKFITSFPVYTAEDEIYYGIDFGFNNPTAVARMKFYDERFIAIEEVIYQTHLTNEQLIEELKIIDPLKKGIYYADSAEPQRIAELQHAGFNVKPAFKGVAFGIDKVKRYQLFVTKSSVNLIKEIRNYKYGERSDGTVMEEPVKFMDHLMDAIRYVVATRIKEFDLSAWDFF